MASVRETGSSPGLMEFAGTGRLLPLLLGMHIRDPQGTDLELRILGAHQNDAQGALTPLAGTMESPEGMS